MCGIVGIGSRASVDERSWLAAGRDAMQHRGPDDAGEWWSPCGRVGLAHRRLSIIDLSPAGHQPMADATGEMCVVFNGEIYNFREVRAELESTGVVFRSASDTEVLLEAYRAWGADCLSRLNGMFAFALYDSRRGVLFLARDRAGEKPLFYSEHNGALRFASELKGLMADTSFERRVDPEALDCYLSDGFVAGDRCILQGVRKVPPAHALTYRLDTGQLELRRYWQPPQLDVSAAPDDAERLVEELEGLLEAAVRRQLVADVPVGVLLSGGIDSSLITAMAVRAASKVKTFTIRFPGYGKYDETEHARLIARHYGTEHVELEAEATTIGLLPMLARQFDEPVIDSSMIPTYLVSRLVRRHCTVALGGDGGDELFGGYSHYNRLLWLRSRAAFLPHPVRKALQLAAGWAMPIGSKGRNWLQALGGNLEGGVPLIAMYHDRASRARLMEARGLSPGAADRIRDSRTPRGSDLLQRATRMDFENYLPEDILVKVDRASMLSSLEVRAPMLDRHVIEFAFGRVPSSMKATEGSRKVLLKKLAVRLFPPQFDEKRKQGFSIPLASWLRTGPWLEYFREVLLGPEQTLFDRRFVQGLLEGHAKGRSNDERLFGLVMFELWRREYRIAL